jgi:hypothetical protein
MPEIQVNTRTPLSGEQFAVKVDASAFARTLAKYRELYPLDNRPFDDLSSDIQHAIIRATQDGLCPGPKKESRRK